jgi:hypothetical protein
MVAIGAQSSGDAHAGDVGEGLVLRRYRIDAQVALVVANQAAVEVVPVRLEKPPHEKMSVTISFMVSPFSTIAGCTVGRAAPIYVPGTEENSRVGGVPYCNFGNRLAVIF